MDNRVRQEIISRLLNSKRVLVTAHRNPDGDSLGSQLGLGGWLAENNIPYAIINEGGIPAKYKFLPGIDQVQTSGQSVDAPGSFDTAVIIECSQFDRIGKVQSLITSGCTVINIDHHQDNVPFGAINLKDISAAAAGEMIYGLLKAEDFTITRDMATNLYTAILTDTGRFHYSGTTARSLRVAAELIELGADPTAITEKVYFEMNPEVVKLTGKVIAGMQYVLEGKVCAMTVSRDMLNGARLGDGDLEGLINYSMYAIGVEVGVLFTELDLTRTKVSFRSHDSINVADIAAVYGGGGHINASGCIVGKPLAAARDAVIDLLKVRLNGSL